jgi:hypothetical protein
MEGMNPRGFFYQCLIRLSSTIPPCTTLFICFDYEYLVQCSMITTHHSCTSIFPICKLQFITFPQNLHAFKKIVILVNDNLHDTSKLYKQTFMFIPFVQHISKLPNYSRKLFLKECVTTFMSTAYIFKCSLKKSCQSSRNLPRDACHHASIRELKRKILVPMITLSTKISATPH